jgi:heme/copper-type cytochrome/quinol oxidase subunit 3
MLRLMLLASLSGIVWGVVGHVLVGDTNMAGGALAGLIVSPVIGLLIGLLAIRANPAGVVRQVLFALVGLYIAVALFAMTVGLWHVTVGWNMAPEVMRRSNRASALLNSILTALLGFTFSGWVVLLWPASVANHMLIWSQLRRSSVQSAG